MEGGSLQMNEKQLPSPFVKDAGNVEEVSPIKEKNTKHLRDHTSQKAGRSILVSSVKDSIKPLLGTRGKKETAIDSCDPDSSSMDNVPLKDLFPNVKVRKRYILERGQRNLDSPSKHQESHDFTNRSREERRIGNLESPVKNQENQESTRTRLRESLAAALRNFGDAEFNRILESEKNAREESEERATRDGVHKLPLETRQRYDDVDSECSMTNNDMVATRQGFQQHGCDHELNGNLFYGTSYFEESPWKKANIEDEKRTEENVETWQLMQQAENVAAKIEMNLFRFFGGINKKYKEKARSLLFNLKDRSNPELRAQVLSRKFTPENLCSMTAEQLASKELSQWRTAKAEEMAHMVVLPDVEIDACRLVKKTHKGEVEVQMEKDDSLLEVVAGGVRQLPTIEVAMQNAKNFQEKWQLDEDDSDTVQLQSFPVGGTLGGQHYNKFDEFAEAEVLEREKLCYAGAQIYLPDIPQQEMQKTTLNLSDANTLMSDGNGCYLLSKAQCFKDPENRSREVNPLQMGKIQRIQRFQSLWEGSLQLSGSEISPVFAYFISGERAGLTSWPETVEVKGRVRLDALDKFLQDLHLSRTRSVMIISCRIENLEENATSVSVSREVANQFEKGERVGFAEPAPGFELYFFPPRGTALKLLSDHGYFDIHKYEELPTDDEILVGCIVWRRNQVSSNIVQKASSPERTSKTLQNSSSRAQLQPLKLLSSPLSLPAPHALPLEQVIQDEKDDDIPPGFGPGAVSKPSVSNIIPNIRTSAIQDNNNDDDDLPEFDFFSENATRELALKVNASKAPIPQLGLPPQVRPFYEHSTQMIPGVFQHFNPNSHPHISPLRHQPVVELSPRIVPLPMLRHPATSVESISQNFQMFPQWPRPPPQQHDGCFSGRHQDGVFLPPPIASSQLNNMAPDFSFGTQNWLHIHSARPFAIPSNESKTATPTSNLLMPQNVNVNRAQGKSLWDDDDMPEWCPPTFIQG